MNFDIKAKIEELVKKISGDKSLLEAFMIMATGQPSFSSPRWVYRTMALPAGIWSIT